MWAVCKHDHGLTWAEFQELTLAEFEALESRRMVGVRHARFNAGLIASALFNINRPADTEAISPFDFVPGFERDPEEVERRAYEKAVKKGVAQRFIAVSGEPLEKVLALRDRMVGELRGEGIEDPERLMLEVFPDLWD